MIVWSDKVRKSVEIFKSVSNELLKRELDLDGIIEIFNDGVEQGTLLKIFDKYNPNIDICIWTYLPTERDCNNQMKVVVGHHIDCLPNNMWQGELPYKVFTMLTAKDLHKSVRDYILEVITTNLDKTIERQTNKERS